MKTEKNIFIAFILNFLFSIFEFFGGILTGSVAILSDAVHDVGDAVSIGFAFVFEKKSKRQPDEKYTYGYTRYAVVGGVITTCILLFGSIAVIYHAVFRIISPKVIHHDGMVLFAIVGVCVNLTATLLTHEGDSLNQKAVNLHLLEDVLGWVVVLIGAIVIKFTDIAILDPLLSIGVATFILVTAVKNLRQPLSLFLEKTPQSVNIHEVKNRLRQIDGVLDVHHVHVWSMDGYRNYATMHIVTNDATHDIKEKVREELRKHGVTHATLELEEPGEPCHEKYCHVECNDLSGHHHHHHHHH